MTRMILAVLMVLTFAPAAGATDGVLEINQACAVNTGCFSGDAAGFPVTITESGSYLLTSNLVLADRNTRGIQVSSPSVSIDLGGFEIVTAACLGATVDCTPPAGSGAGVLSLSQDNFGSSLKNGSITGMGARGVDLGHQANVTNLRIRWNAGIGIVTRDRSRVSATSVYGNGQNGISAQVGSIITGNTVYGNGSRGLSINQGSTISGNTVYQNGDEGIHTADSSEISGNTVYGNGSYGIHAGGGSRVSKNTIRDNTGYGLYLSGSGVDAAGYASNVISDNTEGSVFGSGVEFGPNLCNGDTTCP